MTLFQDWVWDGEDELPLLLDYECEHPGWQCEWDPRMASEFPVFVVGETE